MSKRPLIYELIDTVSGTVFYSSEDKEDAFVSIRQMLVNQPELRSDATFLIIENGAKVKVLARFTGRALTELLEDED